MSKKLKHSKDNRVNRSEKYKYEVAQEIGRVTSDSKITPRITKKSEQ